MVAEWNVPLFHDAGDELATCPGVLHLSSSTCQEPGQDDADPELHVLDLTHGAL